MYIILYIIQMDLKNEIDLFIYFIIFIKILFVLAAICYYVLTNFHIMYISEKNRKILTTKIVYWKDRTEFIFMFCMSILLVYYFRPGLKPSTRPVVNNETAFLFFLFGIILIFTAKWHLFVEEAPWYKKLVHTWL